VLEHWKQDWHVYDTAGRASITKVADLTRRGKWLISLMNADLNFQHEISDAHHRNYSSKALRKFG